MSDLTPDMGDLNGRPPRTQFWAKDLTETHEQFHANDRKTRAPAALRVASNWLGTQQAATAADVGTLLGQVPGRMVADVSAGMTMPGKEERAYGDGAGAYSRRANAIWALGKWVTTDGARAGRAAFARGPRRSRSHVPTCRSPIGEDVHAEDILAANGSPGRPRGCKPRSTPASRCCRRRRPASPAHAADR